MANFLDAFNKTMKNEGGFVLHKNEGDRGGWTFAGIAENFWPQWPGWPLVKAGREEETTGMVHQFYIDNFWSKMKGDQITDQSVAYNIFDFGMNAGMKTAIKMAQTIAGVTPDGAVGPMTLAALNDVDVEFFELQFAIMKIKRYIAISRTRNKQFFRGWVIRTIKVLEQ